MKFQSMWRCVGRSHYLWVVQTLSGCCLSLGGIMSPSVYILSLLGSQYI